MKIRLHVATSVDGFIARENGDSDWVSEEDETIFQEKIKEAGCVILGKKTFDQYYEDIYPIKDVINIVLTTNKSRKDKHKNVFFVDSPARAIKLAEEKKCQSAILAGGSKTNQSFLEKGLIEEITLSIQPIILGSGMNIFSKPFVSNGIDLTDIKRTPHGLPQLTYKIR